MGKIETVSKTPDVLNSINTPKQPEVVRVTVDRGVGEAPDGGPPANSMAAIFARAQAKLDASRTASVPNEEEAPVEDEPPAEGDARGVTAEGDPPPDDDPGEGDPAPDPDAPPEEAEPGTPSGPPPAEVESLQLELAEARRQLADYETTRRRATFDRYFENPLDAMKSWLAETFGVKPDDPIVQKEARALYSELTWDQIPAQDLPDDQQAQLSRERLDRKIERDSFRRQADQRAQQATQQVERARKAATSVYDTVKAEFPAVVLAETIFQKPLGQVLLEVFEEGVRGGHIRDFETKSDAELFKETIRLINPICERWAHNVGSQLATLKPDPAPAASGAGAQTPAAKPPVPSPAPAPKPRTAPPRTLPQSKAGAAPARPGTPKKAKTDEPLPLNSRDRAAAIFKRFGRT